MPTQKSYGQEAGKKPKRSKGLPKASNGPKGRSGAAGVVRTTRPSSARPPAARGGR